MSKQLLTEFFELCPDGRCLDRLSESQKREVIQEGAVYLVGRIQTADKKNGNGRVYPEKVLKKEIDNYQKIIADNRATGELDHPDDSVINLKNVSHMITECWWEGKDVMGKIKVLDTPSGRILKDLINAGVKLGISSRGLGSVRESMTGEVTVEEDFQLICFDIVAEPSTPDAYVSPSDMGSKVSRGAMKFKMAENKENQIDDLFNKILRD
tara:strand:+ start:13305 stop:13937 length:633 start_codon:yes stop_codon:yes gene_type:complete